MNFYSSISPIIKILLISSLGIILVELKWINSQVLKFLINLLVKICVPCLIFSNMMKHKDIFWNTHWSNFLILSIVIFTVGMCLSSIILLFKNFPFKREFMMLVSFQNCGYLPMNISLFLFPKILHHQFLIAIFVYLVGFNILMWSWGVVFLSRKKLNQLDLKTLFTPPVWITIASFLTLYFRIDKFIPSLIIDTTYTLGNTSFVLSLLVLGATLWEERYFLKKHFLKYIWGAVFLKLIAIPLIVYCSINNSTYLDPLTKVFIFIQASMPSAASLPIIASFAQRDKGFISAGVFISHLFSIITVPIVLNIVLKYL